MALENETIKVVFALSSYLPYINVTTIENNTIYSGLLVELLNKLAENMKFKYEVVPQVDGGYGALINGTWKGLVGMVVRKEVDVAVSALTVSYDRSKAIDFTSPFTSESIGILIRLPKKETSLWNILLVFNVQVWFYILASIVVAIIVMRMLIYLDIFTVETCSNCGHLESVWLIYGGLVNEVCQFTAKSWSKRIFHLSWRISAFLLFSTYTGSLIAALTTEQTKLPFNDLKGLADAVEKNQYKICLSESSAFYAAIMYSSSPEYAVLRKYVLANRELATTDCLNKFKNFTNIAITADATYLEYVQKQNCTDFPMVLLRDRFFPGYLALGIQRGSKLNGLFSNSITEMVDNGLVEKWKRKYAQRSTQCDNVVQSKTVVIVQKILLTDISGPFILFAIGICISILIALLERIWMRSG